MYIYWATPYGVYLVGEGMKALRKIPVSRLLEESTANATEKADEHHDVILWFNW